MSSPTRSAKFISPTAKAYKAKFHSNSADLHNVIDTAHTISPKGKILQLKRKFLENLFV